MAEIISQVDDIGSINWVNGLSDPGEMIACGYLPELRRENGEADDAYAERIRPLVMALPQKDRDKIMGAAINRAQLDTTGGKVRVMVAGKPAWHGVGVNVASAVNSEEAEKLAGLDFVVELWESFAQEPRGAGRRDSPRLVKAPDARHVVRTDSGAVLGTVGTRYQPFQNKEAFAFLDSLVEDKLCMFESAGSLKGGAVVWMQCRLPLTLKVNRDDETNTFALLSNAHDGSKALTVMPTTIRAECANTLRRAMNGDGKKLHIRHSASLKGKVKEARECIGLVTENLEKYGEQMELLASTPLTSEEVDRYFKHLYPVELENGGILDPDKSVLDQLMEDRDRSETGYTGRGADVLAELVFAESERTAKKNAAVLQELFDNFEGDSARGSLWGAFNAVTKHVDHGEKYRGANKAEARFSSVMFGSGDEMKQSALNLALEMTT